MPRFVAWVSINFFLGFLPSGLTLLAYTIRTTRTEALRVEELTFSAFMLIATTTLDLVVIDLRKTFKTLFSAILLLLSALATALYCANLFGSEGDLDRRALRTSSLVVTALVALTTFAIQVFLLKNGKPSALTSDVEDEKDEVETDRPLKRREEGGG